MLVTHIPDENLFGNKKFKRTIVDADDMIIPGREH